MHRNMCAYKVMGMYYYLYDTPPYCFTLYVVNVTYA